MGIDVTACLIDVELSQRRVIGAGACEQYVIDRPGERVEEPLEPVEVGGVEGSDTSAQLRPTRSSRSGLRAVIISSAPSSESGAGSSPMPALPPMTTRVCPSRSGRVVRPKELSRLPPRRRSRRQLCPGMLRHHVRGIPLGPVSSASPVRISCSPWAAAARRARLRGPPRTRMTFQRRRSDQVAGS